MAKRKDNRVNHKGIIERIGQLKIYYHLNSFGISDDEFYTVRTRTGKVMLRIRLRDGHILDINRGHHEEKYIRNLQNDIIKVYGGVKY